LATVKLPADATGANPPTNIRIAGAPTDTTGYVPYDFSKDPNYNQFLTTAQTQFENERRNALTSAQRQQLSLEEGQITANEGAKTARQNLAGSFAKRGMMGGRGGVFQRSQAMQNARLYAQQQSTKTKIDALNQDFLANYGTGTGDWTSTTRGQEYNQRAIDQALSLAQQRISGAQ
jgi:hypothetical protein